MEGLDIGLHVTSRKHYREFKSNYRWSKNVRYDPSPVDWSEDVPSCVTTSAVVIVIRTNVNVIVDAGTTMVNPSVDASVVNPTMVVTVSMVDTTMMNPTMVNASVVVAVPMVYPVVNTIVHHPVVDGIVRVLVVVEYVRRVPGLAA